MFFPETLRTSKYAASVQSERREHQTSSGYPQDIAFTTAPLTTWLLEQPRGDCNYWPHLREAAPAPTSSDGNHIHCTSCFAHAPPGRPGIPPRRPRYWLPSPGGRLWSVASYPSSIAAPNSSAAPRPHPLLCSTLRGSHWGTPTGTTNRAAGLMESPIAV